MAAHAVQNRSQEENYLLHLAGIIDTDSPIGQNEYELAKRASKHTVCNSLCSLFNGVVGGSTASVMSFLASPFLVSHFRNNVFGSVEKIKEGLISVLTSLEKKDWISNVDPVSKHWPRYKTAEEFLNFHPEGVNSMSYYLWELMDIATSHPHLILGAAAVTMGTCTIFTMCYLGQKEKNAEKELVQNLKGLYSKIAQKLEDMAIGAEGNPRKTAELKDLVKQILSRRVDIDNEIEQLQLPNLIKIREITSPVFEQAAKIRDKFENNVVRKLDKYRD